MHSDGVTPGGPNWTAEIILQIHPGETGERLLRISPAYMDELRGLLEAEGLRPTQVINKSFTNGPLLYLLSLPVSGVALHSVASVLRTFLTRHKGKEITFGTKGELLSIKGYSDQQAANLVQKTMELVERRQLESDQRPDDA